MAGKHERLKEAYDYLRYQHGIHTQIDMANALQVTRSSFSAAMNGNEKYLTRSLFMKICAAFPGVFNLDYLLNGTGTLLATQEKAEPTPVSHATDNILELHAQMIRRVDDLRQELHQELLAIRELKDELRATLSELKSTTTYEYGMAAETLDEH
jgi:transcriptional regulator with XRE-family HTH domain